ncbi:MAG: hypothetical protein AAFQ37_01205 [Bacteroidota bacterium]
MADFAVGQGFYLAELRKNYHLFREEYLAWAASLGQNSEMTLANYQRAFLAWYEASIDYERPYRGDVWAYLQAAGAHYAGQAGNVRNAWTQEGLVNTADDPLQYLPRSVELTDMQGQMLRQFREMSATCRELLLLAYYHHLADLKLTEVLELGGGAETAADKRRQCLLMIRERWQETGLLDPVYVAPIEQWVLIDRYRRHEMDVSERWEIEALRTSDQVFRDALLLREDWETALLLAGRRDTLENLKQEEADYRPKKEELSVRPTQGRRRIKGLQTYVIGALIAVLTWLALTTFGPSKANRLYKAYFAPFPNITKTQRDSIDAVDRNLIQALALYDRGEYLTTYDDLLPAANAYPSAPLYLGVCALALEQPQRALEWFDQYLPGDRYHAYARWYTALAYLSLDRQPAAMAALLEIAGQAGHPYERQAVELIEALE